MELLTVLALAIAAVGVKTHLKTILLKNPTVKM